MAKEVWLETPPFRDDYQLTLVDTAYMNAAVKPKQFIHIDESECICSFVSRPLRNVGRKNIKSLPGFFFGHGPFQCFHCHG